MNKPGETKSDNKPYDTAFKDLAEQDPEALLRLVGALPEGATVTPLPREVTAPALFPDQPYLVTTQRERFVAHLEAQTYYVGDEPARLVRYDAVLWINTELPVRSYLLILSPRGMPAAAPTTMTVEAGGLTLTVQYQLIKIWEIEAREALSWQRESLLPFVPLMKGGPEELAQGAQALGQVASEARKRELAVHFVMLGGLRYTLAEIFDAVWRYAMVPIQQLKDSAFYQLAVSEGIEKGREEGREKGREEMLRELLLEAVAQRFPGLDVQADLEQVAGTAPLKQLFFDLDDLPDAAALQARLSELVRKH